jgi:hypothetical protein
LLIGVDLRANGMSSDGEDFMLPTPDLLDFRNRFQFGGYGGAPIGTEPQGRDDHGSISRILRHRLQLSPSIALGCYVADVFQT